jgi:P4 family phage/plasmid primase-like protien
VTEYQKSRAGKPPDLAQAVEILFSTGDVVELRTFKDGAIDSGYFDDHAELVKAAEKYDSKGYEIYVTLNRLKKELLFRRANKMARAKRGEGTADQDIVRRVWIFVDADPERPTGISSTDAEKEQGRFRILEMRDFLRDRGWGDGILCDSGNGYHLLYPIDLPNDDESLALIGGVLEALHHKFTDGVVKVDRKTKNAARITKFYGVTAKKGENHPDRPHRQSKILEVTEDLTPVAPELLAEVAALKPAQDRPSSNGSHRGGTMDGQEWVENFIAKHNIPIRREGPWNSNGYSWEIDEPCPWNGHTDTSYWIGVRDSGQIVGGCHHDSCSDYSWDDIREHYEPGFKERKAKFRERAEKHIEVSEPYELTDIGNAERFADQHGKNVRWVSKWGKHFVWTGRVWTLDEREEISNKAQATAKSIHADAAAPELDVEAQRRITRHALASQGGPRIRYMIDLAKSHMAASHTDFDPDPWLLNCQNGTIELRTGELREHRRSDLITKVTPVEYDPTGKAPVFEAFLEQILPSEALRGFVQRAFGAALPGEVLDNILVILHGTGSNGKTTLVEALMEAFGEYAIASAPDLLMSKGNTHPTELADLFGARLVVCMESEEGRRLNEGLVKQLTGRDKLKARWMREEFWEFDPTHTIFLGTNHKPEIRGTDHAIWRRLKLVPFDVTIPDAEQDKELPAKLQKELPGILRWVVEGCLEWQRTGLKEPDEVKGATKSYRADMDVLEQFIEDRCVVASKAHAAASALYLQYQFWCERMGEKPTSQRRFGERLGERGFESFKYTSGLHKDLKGWAGIGLRADDWDPDDDDPSGFGSKNADESASERTDERTDENSESGIGKPEKSRS